MNRIIALLSFAMFLQMALYGQGANVKPEIDEISNLREFIPTGYMLLDSATGDLNADGRTDAILVLNDTREDTIASDEQDFPRLLLVLIQQKDGKLKLVTQSSSVVWCGGCGGVFGDPFTGVSIDAGSFSVSHYGGSNWRWSNTATFKYSNPDQNWYLYQIDTEGFHVDEPDQVESNTKTVADFGKVRFDEYVVEE